MAPKSFNGRLFCMFYALVGIPLNILALKSMGEFINEIIENIVTRIERKLYNRTRKHLHTKVFLCSSLLVLVTLLVGGLLYKSEGWSYFEGVYYSFIGWWKFVTFVYLFTYSLTYLFIYLFVCLFVYLFTNLPAATCK